MSIRWRDTVADAYDRIREQHPPDPATARVAAQELRSRGLTHRDISAALRLSEDAIRALLGEA